MFIPQFLTQIIHALEAKGFEAYVVGGSVRDSFLGNVPSDWDITTSALPDDIIDIFGAGNCIPTGIKHGTVTLLTNCTAVEITTYRIDGEYIDNRRPESITFSKNILDDLSRRDFTVNAMAYNPKTGILDPFGGKSDLNRKIIRAVGEAEKRFTEDALRIMRALRFAAILGFEIEESTKTAIHRCKELLKNIAKERLQTELSKLVAADNPQAILTEFCDVFTEILEGCPLLCGEQWCENAKLLQTADNNLSVRLSLLLDGIAPSRLVLRGLKYDNKTVYEVNTISDYLNLDIKPDPIQIKHIMSDLGEDMLRLILAAKQAKRPEDITLGNINNMLNKIISANQCCSLKGLAVNGNDLIALGISGTEIGRILKLLLNEVIENRCENKKSVLIKLAENFKRLND